MEENKTSIDRVLVSLADSVDIIQKTLIGKVFVVNQLDEESYEKVRKFFKQEDSVKNFIIDISGVEFIFVQNK